MKALQPPVSARCSRNPFARADAYALPDAHEASSQSVCRMRSAAVPFTLDLYHLMGVFTICCMVGLAGETVVSYFVDGRWESRAGFLWSPFSPIYGVGGVLMTVALKPIDRAPTTVLFGVAAFVGGCFEWVASWFWENAFGIVAWSYLDQPFNIGGRTDEPVCRRTRFRMRSGIFRRPLRRCRYAKPVSNDVRLPRFGFPARLRRGNTARFRQPILCS